MDVKGSARHENPPLVWLQQDKRLPLPALRLALRRAAKVRFLANPDSAVAGLYLLLAEALNSAQVFEFGRVPEAEFKEEAKRGGRLIAERLLDLPFQTCVFWSTYVGDDPEHPEARFCTVAHRLDEKYWKTERPEYLILDALCLPPEAVPVIVGPEVDVPSGHDAFIVCGFGTIRPEGDDAWSGSEVEVTYPYTEYDDAAGRLSSLADGVAGLAMILATRNIPTRTEVPPLKVQKKRERNGKFPLPTVTYVDTLRWIDARRNTAARGSHASPVPHLRRGHRRHYPAGTVRGGPEGKTVWIPDMLVNARSYAEVARRDHYEINNEASTDE